MKELSLGILGLGILGFVAFWCWLTRSTEPFWGLLILVILVFSL
jgi:hypothetical protein